MTAPDALVERLAGVLGVVLATHCGHCLRPMASEADWENTEEGERPDLCWEDPANCPLGADVEPQQFYARALLPIVEQEIAAARAEGRALGRYEMTVGHKPDPRDPSYQAGYGRGRAEALREAADAWETDVSDPTPRTGARADGWLRDRAARIARTAAQPATSPEEER